VINNTFGSGNTEDVGVLTTTEKRVLEAFSDGRTRAEIAKIVGLSPRTVGHVLTVAKEKLGARSLAEAAVRYCLATAI
jgi:DNA-binding NarL/FixJ family response regulator